MGWQFMDHSRSWVLAVFLRALLICQFETLCQEIVLHSTSFDWIG